VSAATCRAASVSCSQTWLALADAASCAVPSMARPWCT
jgi:hypothetical protein